MQTLANGVAHLGHGFLFRPASLEHHTAPHVLGFVYRDSACLATVQRDALGLAYLSVHVPSVTAWRDMEEQCQTLIASYNAPRLRREPPVLRLSPAEAWSDTVRRQFRAFCHAAR